MNVMAQAHKVTRETVNASPVKLSYRPLFIANLKDAHKMNKEEQAKKDAHKAWAIEHFEDCIEKTLKHFEALGVNDFYVAILNNARTNDYTLLQHKVEGDVNSPLGWANYKDAIKTSRKHAEQYEIAFPSVVKLHAQTHLSKTLDYLRDQLEQIKAK